MKLQTDFCATRCSIWGFALVGTEGGGLLGEAGGDRGRPGETGGDRGRPGETREDWGIHAGYCLGIVGECANFATCS